LFIFTTYKYLNYLLANPVLHIAVLLRALVKE